MPCRHVSRPSYLFCECLPHSCIYSGTIYCNQISICKTAIMHNVKCKKKTFITIFSAALILFSYVWKIAKVIGLPNETSTLNATLHVSEHLTGLQTKFTCTVPNKYFKISEIANYVDSIITLIIPFTLITCSNIGIVMSVRRLSLQRNHLLSTSLSTNAVRKDLASASTRKPHLSQVR